MREAPTVEPPQPPGAPEAKVIVRALRRHTGQTQEAAADKSGVLGRDEFSRIETGRILATSSRARTGLARAFDLRVETMSDLLDGHISLEEAIRRIGERERPVGSPRLSDRPEWKTTNVLAEAQALHRQMYGSSSPALWAQLAEVLDSAPFPRPLTPGFLASVAHALALPAQPWPGAEPARQSEPEPHATGTIRTANPRARRPPADS
jgi:transcriptional regulator with XRE-family HTH domain